MFAQLDLYLCFKQFCFFHEVLAKKPLDLHNTLNAQGKVLELLLLFCEGVSTLLALLHLLLYLGDYVGGHSGLLPLTDRNYILREIRREKV
jgi:hypothetical protein